MLQVEESIFRNIDVFVPNTSNKQTVPSCCVLIQGSYVYGVKEGENAASTDHYVRFSGEDRCIFRMLDKKVGAPRQLVHGHFECCSESVRQGSKLHNC